MCSEASGVRGVPPHGRLGPGLRRSPANAPRATLRLPRVPERAKLAGMGSSSSIWAHRLASSGAVSATVLPLLLVLAGCGECPSAGPESCPTVDEDLSELSGYTVVHLHPDSSAMLAGGSVEVGPVAVRDGFFAFRVDDPDCVPSPESPCEYLLGGMRFLLADFTLGQRHIEGLTYGIQGPQALLPTDAGAELPALTPCSACGAVDGKVRASNRPTPDTTRLTLDVAAERFEAEGSFEAVFDLGGTSSLLPGASVGAATLTVTATLDASGVTPWSYP